MDADNSNEKLLADIEGQARRNPHNSNFENCIFPDQRDDVPGNRSTNLNSSSIVIVCSTKEMSMELINPT